MFEVLLSFGGVDALIPLIIVVIIIGAAAGLTRKFDFLSFLGISVLAGVGFGGKGAIAGKSGYSRLGGSAISKASGKTAKNLGKIAGVSGGTLSAVAAAKIGNVIKTRSEAKQQAKADMAAAAAGGPSKTPDTGNTFETGSKRRRVKMAVKYFGVGALGAAGLSWTRTSNKKLKGLKGERPKTVAGEQYEPPFVEQLDKYRAELGILVAELRKYKDVNYAGAKAVQSKDPKDQEEYEKLVKALPAKDRHNYLRLLDRERIVNERKNILQSAAENRITNLNGYAADHQEKANALEKATTKYEEMVRQEDIIGIEKAYEEKRRADEQLRKLEKTTRNKLSKDYAGFNKHVEAPGEQEKAFKKATEFADISKYADVSKLVEEQSKKKIKPFEKADTLPKRGPKDYWLPYRMYEKYKKKNSSGEENENG